MIVTGLATLYTVLIIYGRQGDSVGSTVTSHEKVLGLFLSEGSGPFCVGFACFCKQTTQLCLRVYSL